MKPIRIGCLLGIFLSVTVVPAAHATPQNQPADAALAGKKAYMDTLILHQSFAEVEALLQSEPRLFEAKDIRGFTVLHTALASGPVKPSVPFITWLLAHGANVNATAGDGSTPLMMAVQDKDPEIVSMFLKAGANPKVVDRNGFTALSWASMSGFDQVASELIKAGAEPDFFQAAQLGLTGRLTVFLRTDPKLIDAREPRSQRTALELAAMHRHAAAVRLLVSFHPTLDVYSAAVAGQNEFLRSHLTKDDPAVNARDPYTHATPLQMAVEGGDLKTMTLLLDYGANVNAGNPGSALSAAIHSGDKEAVKLLVGRGADTKRSLPGFGNAYTMALAMHRPDIAELVK